MGALTSVVTPLLSIARTVSTAKSASSNAAEIDLKNKQIADRAAAEKQKNLLDLQNRETTRLAKLRSALATKRAEFGSQGIGSATGSAESVLTGLVGSSDIERQQNEASTALQNKIIDDTAETDRQLNLLQKQQLKQKSTLSYLTSWA